MKRLFLLPLFLLTLQLSAQEPGTDTESKTIRSTFDEMISKSNRYQDFKVVKIVKLNAFIREVQDSLNVLQKNIAAQAKTESALNSEVDALNNTISKGNERIAELEGQRDNIETLGMSVSKSAFATGMWFAVLALLGLLIAVILRNKSISMAQRAVKANLSDLEDELSATKKKALEREQELKREVQDYVNKIEAMGPPR